MKRYLLYLSFVATWLCGILLGSNTKVQDTVSNRQQDEQQIQRHDGWIRHVAEEPETLPVSLLRPTTSHRVASSRSARLLPTHGGKPSQHSGRWAKGQLSYPPYCPIQLPCISRQRLCMAAASPRHYYVIALRRLLC